MAKVLSLTRITEHDGGTFGVLCIDNSPEFVTLEEAWHFNERKISCIPPGKYTIKQVYSPRFGRTYEVRDVPNRSHILFHAGNTVAATEGCILVGTHFGKLEHRSAILKSKAAFERFLTLMGNTPEAQLIISEAHKGGLH